MATIALSRTGQKMPLVGFGLWKVTKSSTADTVYKALQAGYRLLDGAGDYGNEKEAGEGLARAIKDGVVKREEVFVTSKLWNTFHAKEHVAKLARKQLADWQLEYFDLFLIHFPISLKYVDPETRYPPEWFYDGKSQVELQNTPYEETYHAMETLVDEGLAKNIGISNVNGSLLIDILRYARIKPAVLQVELHPYLPQEQLVTLCKKYDIAITAYCSFGPASWLELDMHKHVPSLLDHDVVAQVAKKYSGKTPAQVLLRWASQRGIAVIPKSNNHDRLVQNLNHTDITLDEADIATLTSLNQNARFNDPGSIDPRIAIFA
ncbi:putative D-xylose reductase [Exidia glandulosa HHB12029]|uniref:Putative D-xylose reductase n=1 Tax=Exidia glandulosa HHB12029 TaxID=1314781 RepID=A0A165NAE8_EXIGL|nr:putative D-xylose reductase [Exidia glandulosa HHB12029]